MGIEYGIKSNNYETDIIISSFNNLYYFPFTLTTFLLVLI